MPDDSESEESVAVKPSIDPLTVVQGEDQHKKGDDGEQAIMRWLHMTTRVRTFYRRNSELTRRLLVYKWPYTSNTFSYDFGGEFRGGEIEGQCFLAEAKAHGTSSNLPGHFRKFLGQCYAIAAYSPNPPSHYLWVSYAPHGTDKWESLASYSEVADAVLHVDNRKRLLGTEDEGAAAAEIDHQAVAAVAESVWVVVFSERFQTIEMEMEHFKLIQSQIAEEAVPL